jgi:hypothetical protein
MKTLDCYVVTRKAYGHVYPVRAFTRKDRAKEYKEIQTDIDGKDYYLETVTLEIDDDEQ